MSAPQRRGNGVAAFGTSTLDATMTPTVDRMKASDVVSVRRNASLQNVIALNFSRERRA